MYSWDHENCPLYGVVGCLGVAKVNGRTVGIFRIVLSVVCGGTGPCNFKVDKPGRVA